MKKYTDPVEYFDENGPLKTSSILRDQLSRLAKDQILSDLLNAEYFKRHTNMGSLDNKFIREYQARVSELVWATALASHIIMSPKQINKDEKLHKFLKAPLCQIGSLSTLDRTEIEGLRSAQNLIRQYLITIKNSKNASDIRPFSMAIFGPPGSGKSFAAKQLCTFAKQTLAHQVATRGSHNAHSMSLSLNLVKIYTKVMIWCREQAIHGSVPVVLFDEFDSSHNGKEMEWLKHFLPVMEDGEFKTEEDGVIKIGPGIFIFAGGVNRTFDDFRNKIIDSSNHPIQEDLEKNQKGAPPKSQDFLSRLRGFVNILGIDGEFNSIIDLKDTESPNIYITSIKEGRFHGVDKKSAAQNEHRPTSHLRPEVILRRGVLLRVILETQVNTRRKDFIDVPLLNAFLLIPQYTHGARSMRSIVNMCNPIEETLVPMSLPPLHQLQMHVEATTFQGIIANPPVSQLILDKVQT